MMLSYELSSKRYSQTNPIFQIVLGMILLLIGVESLVNRVNDPKFVTGYKSLFTQNLTSFPLSTTYQISFPYSMPSPTTYYDLVVSINTFSFVQSNTIGWNFTKSNLSLTGFTLRYDAGVNSVIYTLAINYMIVDNSYPDFQIAYFSVQCRIMSIGTDFRSQNVTYTVKKFSNDSNYARMTVLQSFNMTNTMVDNLILKNNFYQTNMTIIVQYYTWGLAIVNDFQFYLILYNTAYSQATMARSVTVNMWTLSPSTTATTIQSSMLSDYQQVNRFFSGVSGLNLTRSGNKTFQFRLYVGNIFQFAFSSTGVVNVDYSGLSVFVIQCPSGYWSALSNDCVATCSTPQFADTSNALAFCSNCDYSCTGCFDAKPTSCKVCSSVTRNPVRTATVTGNNWYSCSCNVGYFEVYQADCAACSTTLPACIKCSNNATCLECQTGLKIYNNKCVCNNPNQTYFNGACINRIFGCQTHVYNGSQYLCVECYVERNFTITNSFTCVCQIPLYQTVQDVTGYGDFWCKYVCGDGYVAPSQECDDNNLMSGDGCSNNCTVERNFTCSNLVNQSSVCLYNLTADLVFVWGERRMYENTAVLNFTIEPYCTYWSQITNWSAIVNTNMPVKKIQDDFFCPNLWSSLRCNLTLTVQYTGHLQDQPFTISLNLSSQQKIRFNSRQLVFTPTGNIAQLTYQNGDILNSLYTMDRLMLALAIITLIISLIGVYFDKMIGIQTIMTLQFIYYLLVGIKDNKVEFVPMGRYLKYSTGYNTIYNYTYGNYAQMSNQINHIYYEKEFLLNMNVMLLILVIFVFIFIVVKMFKMLMEFINKRRQEDSNVSRLFQSDVKKESRYFQSFYKFYWNNVMFVAFMFLMYQVLFDCIITVILDKPVWTIFSTSLNFISELFALFFIMMGILAVCYWYYQASRKRGRIALQNGQFIPLQFKLCQKQYILMYTLVQPLKIWILALFYNQSYCYYIILPICVIYFVVLVIYRPYRKTDSILDSIDEDDPQADQKLCFSIHNFAIAFNQFCLIIFIVLCLVWNNNSNPLDSNFPLVILYISIPIILLINIVAILRMFYKKLGVLLMCDYFKDRSQGDSLSYDNQSQKMRKLVRNENTKIIPNDQIQSANYDDNVPPARKQRSKILQDVKKARQFMVDWKDDSKPVYYNNQYPDSQEDDDTFGDKKSQNQNNMTRFQNSIINIHPEGLIYTNRSRGNNRNPGMVEMDSIPKALNQSNYQYTNKSSDKKAGLLNKSVLQSLLDKKQEEISTNRKVTTSMLNKDAISEDRKRSNQDLFYVKERLRRQLEMKNSKLNNDTKEYVLKD